MNTQHRVGACDDNGRHAFDLDQKTCDCGLYTRTPFGIVPTVDKPLSVYDHIDSKTHNRATGEKY